MTDVSSVVRRWFLRLLAVLRLRRQAHPHILRAQTVRLDTEGIARAAASGVPFGIPLGKRVATVVVSDSTVWDGDFSAVEIDLEDQRPVEPEANIHYVGVVEGDEPSEVRLTITPDQVSGYLLVSDGWWFVEPKRKFDPKAERDEHLIYRTKDLHFKLEYGNDVRLGDERGEGGVEPAHRVNPIVGIAMLADREYESQANVTGISWWQQQASLINQINGIFRARLGSEFRVRVFILDRRPSPLNSTNADDLLDQVHDPIDIVVGNIRQLSVRQSSGVEVAHLTSGKNLEGNTLGIAWQPGVYSLSQQQLFWLGGGGGLFGGGPNLAYQNMMVPTHELGHNFNGAHEEADEWCVAHFIWCWDYERTIMWPTYYDDNQSFFSNGSRSAGHNNRRRISDNFATGRNRNFT
jgi:metallopeptidase family M12-like protein